MRIRSHSESHELEDGSRWQIFPGDLDPTLDWKPEFLRVVTSVKNRWMSNNSLHSWSCDPAHLPLSDKLIRVTMPSQACSSRAG
jgi:hypothetical protein